jgi:hypothetical protein
MTDTLVASTYVDAPAGPPRHGGLLDVATVIDRPDGLWELGVQWDSEVCGEIGSYDSDCLEIPAGETKDVVGANPQESNAFVIHAAVACGLLVAGDRYERHARALLRGHESEEVEHRLSMRWVDTPGNTITGTGAARNIVNAFSELEMQGSEYGAAPIIHLTPEWATLAAAAGLFTYDAIPGVLTTWLGTRVSVGHGYRRASKSDILNNNAQGAPAPATGEAWLFITGWVTLERSPITETVAIDHKKNTKYALAERVYVPMTDCLVGGVLAKKSA